MLQFFKKHSDSKRGGDDPQQRTATSSPAALLRRGAAAVVDDRLLDAEKCCQELEQIHHQQQTQQQQQTSEYGFPVAPTSTRGFAKQILHIVTNKNALSFFVQFLDTRDALPLIKFWLDADSFRIAAGAELSRNSSLAGTPLPVEHRSHVGTTGRTKPVLRKSVSLDAFNATSYDDESLCGDSGSQCTVGSLEDLPEDGEESDTMGSNRCVSSCSTSELSNGVGDQESTDAETKAHIQEMGRPLTDDEKRQLCEQKHLQMNENVHAESAPKRSCFQTSLASDAVRIYKKYLTNKSAYLIDIPATHLSAIALALGSTDASTIEESEAIKNIFVDAQSYVLDTLDRTHLEDFLQSSFYAKYCVDVLTSERLGIEDILYSDAALFYLMEFLEQDSQRHLLEFWVAAVNFAKLCNHPENGTMDVGQLQSDALVLYEKYFSLQATCSLGLSDWVRSRIEEDICTTDRMVIGHCFDRAVAVIERYLDQKYFKAFVTSHLFYRYLSELLHKIDEPMANQLANGANQSQPTYSTNTQSKSRHRKTASDVSADQFQRNISTQNTLLAMDTNPAKKQTAIVPSKMRSSTSTDMLIDGRLLNDPDLLWARRSGGSVASTSNRGGLSFGRVNALGRYERDFDMEPSIAQRAGDPPAKQPLTATTSSKLRRVVRKLVNLPEDRAQEEIAWQVAEMIVRDITSVTMHGGQQMGAVVDATANIS